MQDAGMIWQTHELMSDLRDWNALHKNNEDYIFLRNCSIQPVSLIYFWIQTLHTSRHLWKRKQSDQEMQLFNQLSFEWASTVLSVKVGFQNWWCYALLCKVRVKTKFQHIAWVGRERIVKNANKWLTSLDPSKFSSSRNLISVYSKIIEQTQWSFSHVLLQMCYTLAES